METRRGGRVPPTQDAGLQAAPFFAIVRRCSSVLSPTIGFCHLLPLPDYHPLLPVIV